MNGPETNLPIWLAFLALAEQATRDHLTGLYNRRYFDETLADHVAAANRYDRELALILFDIDDFKSINDTAGHDAGDEALRQFANLLGTTARKADIICRYGGDEFAILLPETAEPEAQAFIERVRRTLFATEAAFSVTAGSAALPCPDLVHDADRDLLARKRASRQ